MPFTLAHPAAVLPLTRGPLVGAALVAGAMAPDVPYFLRRAPIEVTAQSWYEPFLNATTSHGLTGAVLVDLPLGLALYVGYLLARTPLAATAPLLVPAGRRRATPGRAWWVVVSLVVGIATHLLWDVLTVTRLLQHLSTALGLVVVAAYLWRRRNPVAPRRVLAALGLAVLLAAAATLLAAGSWRRADGAAVLLSAAATTTGVLAVASLAAAVTGWWLVAGLRALRRRRPGPSR